MPFRPSYGRSGTQSVLWTNYFDMRLNEKRQLFRYDVQIEPITEKALEIKHRRKRRQLFKLLFAEVADFQALGHAIVTDYANTLITCEQLFDKILTEKIFNQVYRGEYERPQAQDDPGKLQKYAVTVKFRDLVSVSEVMKYITSDPTPVSDSTPAQDTVQTLNIVVAGTPNQDGTVFQTGPNKFYRYPRNETNGNFDNVYGNFDLGGGLIAVRGYYSSVRTATSRLLLNLNAQCSAFYPEMNLLDMMALFRRGSNTPPNNPDLEAFISKLRVRTNYTKDGNQVVIMVMTVKGFSRRWQPSLDEKGNQKFDRDSNLMMKGTKGTDHDWGTAFNIQFYCDSVDPPKTLTVREYFQRGKPVLICG